MVFTERLAIPSEGDFYVVNITEQVREVVQRSGIRAGSALIFYQHTTGAVMIVEHELGILVDLEDVLEKLAPVAGEWKHHLRGYDTNGAAHLRSALLGVSLTVPIVDGDLPLGTYQEIVVVDMDPGRKTRTAIVQVMGE